MFDLPEIWEPVARGAILTIVTLVWIVALVRIVGLRAFSKMTSFDFVATVAAGSLLATAATSDGWSAYFQALVALGALFAVQYVIARLRKASDGFETAIQNEPLLLMRDGVMIESALAKSRVARSDVIAKLREANALELTKVRAVVLETTGDISVLHGDHVDPVLLEGVRGTDA
jgi:uncharacterized membrane protein YcaP (DUF421 family)